MKPITESHIEEFALEELTKLEWDYAYGPDISPEGSNPARTSFEDVVLADKLRNAVTKINPHIPVDALEQAVQKVLRIYSPDLLHNNETFHVLLVEKVRIPYQQDGFERSHEIALVDFDNPLNNDFLAVNQFTILHNNQNKRPDVILFINGLPMVVMELKNPAEENATIDHAFEQIQTYKAVIPSLFTYNEICIISDGIECKAGSISAGKGRFVPWKSIDGSKDASRFIPQMETLIKGMLNPQALLDIIRNFIVFEKSRKEDPGTGITQVITVKKLAAYHQYYAVNKAVTQTITAASPSGDRKGGVVWHTTGSGKSLSMVFFTGKLVLSLNNPTIVVITDRNDLDDQLFDTFANSTQLLRQEPHQAESREDIKKLLKVASGGIIFTTIHKFWPDEGKEVYDELSDRQNIVVIADEAHRTQYGFEAKYKDIVDKSTGEVVGKRVAYGFAKYLRDALPNATYIGFTGTPIESSDVNTPAVFGKYVDIYDISQSIADKTTVKIYYESRLAKVNLNEEGKRLIGEFDKDLEESEELSEAEKAKAKWSKLEAIIGNKERLKNLASDIVTHFEERRATMDGKAMIVAMSRRIAVDLYNEIIKIKPEWHSDDFNEGSIKVIMTAVSSDGPVMAKHHTTKNQRKTLADRMKDPSDSLKIVIVRDMWLTGFDVPCLNTMYIDKPMRGHTLMQTISRVNRVFQDKPGGLIVDYLGIATDMKKALSFYSDSGGKGEPAEDLDRAVDVMLEKLEVVTQMFSEKCKSEGDILLEEPSAYINSAFDYKRFFTASSRDKLSIILQSEEHILGLDDGKERFIKEVILLSQAFSLSISKPEAAAITELVAFFQAVKARLTKFTGTGSGERDLNLESIIKQIVNEAISSEKVVDIFDAAGLKRPEIPILSEEFMLEIQGMKHKNLALELLKKILNDEIKSRLKTNLVKGKALLEMLEASIKRYQNNLLSTAEIIQELINIAKEVKEADKKGEKLGLSTDEVAFYNALEVNESAVQVLGDDTLKHIAREIADKVRSNATIDWTIRESARANLMRLVSRTLRKYGYPPDMQQKAIDTVLKQAELMADFWVNE
ncbi:MAG: type I restriction endonuclease subunit R [Ignavibacteria bacterium]|nr:type I restriction endonuclease subunit R [Ignavibacteria bacterium]